MVGVTPAEEVTLQDTVLDYANTIRIPEDEDRDPPEKGKARMEASDASSQAESIGGQEDEVSKPDSEAERLQATPETLGSMTHQDTRVGSATNLLARIRHFWGRGGPGGSLPR